MSISSHHDAANLTGNAGVGRLVVVGEGAASAIGGELEATMVGTGGYFTVRRVAA